MQQVGFQTHSRQTVGHIKRLPAAQTLAGVRQGADFVAPQVKIDRLLAADGVRLPGHQVDAGGVVIGAHQEGVAQAARSEVGGGGVLHEQDALTGAGHPADELGGGDQVVRFVGVNCAVGHDFVDSFVGGLTFGNGRRRRRKLPVNRLNRHK